jgi:hypothetical protein
MSDGSRRRPVAAGSGGWRRINIIIIMGDGAELLMMGSALHTTTYLV